MLKQCIWCGLVFETNSVKTKLCPDCTGTQKPHSKGKPKTRSKAPSIQEVMHIASVYDFINGTRILNHYGTIVNIIKNTKPGRCVCCGKKGKKVCEVCESKYKNHRDGGRK